MLKISWNYKGYRSEAFVNREEIFVGRTMGLFKPHISLNLDLTIQSKHARIFRRDDMWWVEDLGTPHGTALNGERLTDPMVIMPGDRVELGKTVVTIEEVDREPETAPPPPSAAPAATASRPEAMPTGGSAGGSAAPGGAGMSWLAPVQEALPENVVIGSNGAPRMICASVSALNRGPMFFDTQREDAQERISTLFELPLEMAAERDLPDLCRLVLHRVTEMIPGAKRGAFLVIDRQSGKLALRAGIPRDNPPISRSLIKRAAATGEGFVWSSAGMEGYSGSIQQQSISSGMFAPLIWREDVIGVVTVDNPNDPNAFNDEDLRFFMAVAHYSAAAIQSHLLSSQLSEHATVLERLLTNFSPKIRQTLVDKALGPGLQPGGELSDVTVLMSDFRSFTRISQGMETEEVMAMLNDYFEELVACVFAHQGTVDKFIGDAILAVFGSPEEDPDQVRHALDAALAMQTRMREINHRREMAGLPFCDFGVGVHRGRVLHGFVGAKDHLEYTVVGDPVNMVSRYCAGANADEILVSRAVWEVAQNDYRFEARTVPVKHEADIPAWSLLGVQS